MKEIDRTVLKFVVGFTVTVVASAVLAPVIYQILPFFKFDRILRRLIMIGTFILVFQLIRERLGSFTRMGLKWREESKRVLTTGFWSGVVLVTIMTLIQWGLGARIWHLNESDIWHWIGFFIKGFFAGVLIGALEEFFFRGFLFLVLKDLWGFKRSLVVTNVIYAVVHYFPKNKPPVGHPPTVWDSFRILGHFGPSLVESPGNLVGLLGLFLFGLLLSFAFVRTGSLYLPTGIHAGSVFALKMNRRFFPDVFGKMNLMSGTKNLYDGALGVVILALGAILASRIKLKGKVLAVFLVPWLILMPVAVCAGESQNQEKPSHSLVEHLSEAQAVREIGGRFYEGRWKDSRFEFEGLPETATISVTDSISVEGRKLPVIALYSLPRGTLTFVFPEINRAKKLSVVFAMPDWTFAKGKFSPAYGEVWVGRKKMARVRLDQKGWHPLTVDLALPFLLGKSSPITLRIRTLNEEPQLVVFHGSAE